MKTEKTRDIPHHKNKDNKLYIIRTILSLTQAELAEALNMKQGSIADIERGKNNLSFGNTLKLWEVFNVNPAWFFDDSLSPFLPKFEPFKIVNGIKIYLNARPIPLFKTNS